MTGAWLLANDLKLISDCTGGRKGDAVRYCQLEPISFPKANAMKSMSALHTPNKCFFPKTIITCLS